MGMTIDKIIKAADKKLGKCFVNGIYHYRSDEPKEKKTYCCLGDEGCIYYRTHKGKDYCNKVPKK